MESEIKANCDKLDNVKPVSYTHLDVYKRQVWDCILENEPGELDQQLLYDIHTKVSASHAKIVLLDAAYAVKSNTEYLQRLADSVWFRADTETNTEICTMITAGANGILVQDETQAYKIFSFLGNNAVTRKIFVIGHRGLPSSVPENTTEGAVAAAKAGATHIAVSYTHLDVYKRQV